MGYATKSERVNSLVEYYGKENKSEFARLLGTTPQVIATWITRDTMNYDLIYAKYEGLSAHWLLSGEGDILQSTVHQSNPQQEAAPAQLTGLIRELMNELRQKTKR